MRLKRYNVDVKNLNDFPLRQLACRCVCITALFSCSVVMFLTWRASQNFWPLFISWLAEYAYSQLLDWLFQDSQWLSPDWLLQDYCYLRISSCLSRDLVLKTKIKLGCPIISYFLSCYWLVPETVQGSSLHFLGHQLGNFTFLLA
jgi:hypothetical protein